MKYLVGICESPTEKRLEHFGTHSNRDICTHTQTQEEVCEFTFATRTVSDASEKAFVST